MSHWDDDDAKAWQRKRAVNVKFGNWKHITVGLEMRRGFVTLTRKEWESYQTFLLRYDVAEVRDLAPEKYEYLPQNVKTIIEDWKLHLSGAPYLNP